MFKFGYITKEYINKHNPNWSEIPDHSYMNMKLLVGGSGFGKKHALLNLIYHKPDIDKYFYPPKIHINRNINCELTKKKVQD